jgi:hypothetical protein
MGLSDDGADNPDYISSSQLSDERCERTDVDTGYVDKNVFIFSRDNLSLVELFLGMGQATIWE